MVVFLLDNILMLIMTRGEVVGLSTRFMVRIMRVAKLKPQAEVCSSMIFFMPL